MTRRPDAVGGHGPRSTSTRSTHNVGVLRKAAAPAGVWAVVKAEATATARVAVGARRARAGVRRAVRRPHRRGGGAAPGRHRRRRSSCSASSRPSTPTTIVAHDLTPTVTTAAAIDALARGRRDGDRRRPPQGRHRDAPRRRRAGRRRRRSSPHRRRRAGRAAAPASSPTSPSPTSSTTRTPPTSWPRSTRCSTALRPTCGRSSCTPATRPARWPTRRPPRRSSAPASPCTASRPGPASTTSRAELRPVLSLRARVSFVKRLPAGDAPVVRPAPRAAARRQRGDRPARLRRRRAPQPAATSVPC